MRNKSLRTFVPGERERERERKRERLFAGLITRVVVHFEVARNETDGKRRIIAALKLFGKKGIENSFCSTSLPLASTRWVRSSFSSHCLLFTKAGSGS